MECPGGTDADIMLGWKGDSSHGEPAFRQHGLWWAAIFSAGAATRRRPHFPYRLLKQHFARYAASRRRRQQSPRTPVGDVDA